MKRAEELTLKEKIGQLYIMGFHGLEMNDVLRTAICEWKVGGFVFGRGNADNPFQVKRLIQDMQNLALETIGIPLLIAVNQEGGELVNERAGYPTHPGNMALGATGSTVVAAEAVSLQSSILKAMGYTCNFAPVLDLQVQPKNTACAIRSFGDDPATVAAFGKAHIHAQQKIGLAACAKHFPGKGDALKDAHWDSVVINKTKKELMVAELVPFITAIEAGVDMIMTSHILYPQLDEKNLVTFSDKIIQGLLRQEMGFKGIVITDALDMGALRLRYRPEAAAVRAINAGTDVILQRHNWKKHKAILQHLEKAASNGAISAQRIHEASGRVLALKARYPHGFAQAPLDWLYGPALSRSFSAIAQKAITVVRDNKKLLPLSGINDKTRVVIIQPFIVRPYKIDMGRPEMPEMFHALARAFPDLNNYQIFYTSFDVSDAEIKRICTAAQSADWVFAGTFQALANKSQAKLVKKLGKFCKNLIVLSFDTPYDICAFPEIPTYICAYGMNAELQNAAVAVMTGTVPAVGKLPVSLKEAY